MFPHPKFVSKSFHTQTWRYFSPVSDIDGASYFVLTFSQQSRHKDRQRLAPTSSDSLYVIGLCCWHGLCLGCQLWGKRTQQKSWDAESFIDSRNYLQVELWSRRSWHTSPSLIIYTFNIIHSEFALKYQCFFFLSKNFLSHIFVNF